MLLSQLYLSDGKKYISDKFSSHHDYIPAIYDKYFVDIKDSAKTILEIGIHGGSSLILWRDYFTNARIIGLDIKSCKQFDKPEYQFKDIFCIVGDAYSLNVIDLVPSNLDVAIDDGSHRLDDILFFIDNYLPKVKSGGYLVVEDILPDYVDTLLKKISGLEYELHQNLELQEDNCLIIIKKT